MVTARTAVGTRNAGSVVCRTRSATVTRARGRIGRAGIATSAQRAAPNPRTASAANSARIPPKTGQEPGSQERADRVPEALPCAVPAEDRPRPPAQACHRRRRRRGERGRRSALTQPRQREEQRSAQRRAEPGDHGEGQQPADHHRLDPDPVAERAEHRLQDHLGDVVERQHRPERQEREPDVVRLRPQCRGDAVGAERRREPGEVPGVPRSERPQAPPPRAEKQSRPGP